MSSFGIVHGTFLETKDEYIVRFLETYCSSQIIPETPFALASAEYCIHVPNTAASRF